MKLPLRTLVILSSVIILFITLILNFFVFQKSQEEEYVEAIESRIQQIDKRFDEDYIQVLMDVRPEDTLSFSRISSRSYALPFFILNSEKSLLFWSDYTLSFDFSSLDLSEEFQLIEDPFGTILVKSRKISRSSQDFYLIQAYRLVWPGSIENDYIKTGPNPEIFGNDRFQIFSNPDEGNYQVKTKAGQPLFGINFQLGFESAGRVSNTPLLIFICSVFLLYFLFSFDFLRKKWKKGYPWQTIGYGSLVLIFVRIGMLLLDFPGDFFEFPMFDPTHYASSWINPSLGDLILNTACAVFILGLVIYQLASKPSLEKAKNWVAKLSVPTAILLVYIYSYFFFVFIWFLHRDLIFNSQWILDIRSIPSFDLFKGFSFLILFLWGAVYVLLSLTMFSLLLHVKKEKVVLFQYLLAVALPVVFGLFLIGFWLGLAASVHFVFLFSIIRFELFQNVFRLGLDTFLTFFYACLITAIISGISTFQTERERLIQSKVSYANQNLIENDVMTEFFLGDIFTRVKSDLFIQNRMADPLLSKDPIVTKKRSIGAAFSAI